MILPLLRRKIEKKIRLLPWMPNSRKCRKIELGTGWNYLLENMQFVIDGSIRPSINIMYQLITTNPNLLRRGLRSKKGLTTRIYFIQW